LVSQYPNTSYCTMQYLWAGYYSGSYRSLLHFNVATIPRDAEVLNAELGLYLYTTQWSQASTTTVNLDPATRGGWTMAATWNSYDGTNYWTTPGGDYTPSPAASTTVALGASGWTYWNPLNLVQGWVSGSIANNGVMLAASTESLTNLVEFYSTQNPAPQQDWPYLLVQYSLRTGEQSFDTMVGFGLSDGMDMGVNVTNGNLMLHQSDLSMDGVGLPLTIDHYYNSLAPYSDPEFVGEGWSLDLGSPAQIVSLGDVGALDLIGPSGYQIPFSRNADGSYSSPPALDATLTSSGSYLFLTFNRTRDKHVFWNNGIGNYYDLANQNPSTDSIFIRHQAVSQGSYEQVTGITDTQNRSTSFTYNSSGDVALIQDPSGRVYSYAYDQPGNHLLSYSDPSGGVTSCSYSTVSGANPVYNVLVQITNPSGEVTKIGYSPDSYGIPRVANVTQTTPGTPCASPGCTTSFTYNSFGQTTVTDPNGHAVGYTYDALGRATAVKDAYGQTWQTSWTDDSHVASETTPGGHTTTYAYDALNNLTQVSLPTGPTMHWTYGNPTWIHQPSSFTDEENRTTSFSYDAVGRLNKVTDPLGHSTTTVYNANGTAASDTDANGHVTSYSYSTSGTSIGLLSQVTPPSPIGTETIAYDSANRTLTDTDGNGQKSQYSYDPLDQVTGISFSKFDGSFDSSMGYAYDTDGNTLAMTDSTGTTGYTYDTLGELLSETLPTGVRLGDGHSVDYAYDPAGNLLSKTDGSGKTTYAYRVDDLVSSVTDPLGAQTTFIYDSDDNLLLIRYATHVLEEMNHDSSGQLTRMWALYDLTNPVITLNSYTYSYTNPTTLQATTTRYSMTDISGNKTTYTYDAASELKTATQNNSAGTQLHGYSFGYDPVGNMTSSTVDGSQTTMSFNAADELTQESGASSMALQYDANGNQTNT
jgi:YD repeat-containing protein